MKQKTGLIICFCIALCLIFQIDRLYCQSIIIKPITTNNIDSSIRSPWCIRVTSAFDEVNLIAQSMYPFVLTEIDSNNRKHIMQAIDNDGLFLVDKKIHLNSKYMASYNEIYYSLDSSKTFTYNEEKSRSKVELVFMIFINISPLVVMILFFMTRRPDKEIVKS